MEANACLQTLSIV